MATALEPRAGTATFAQSATFRTLRSAEELRACEAQWIDLDRRVPSPSQTFAWIEASAATFGDAARIEVVVGNDGDDLVAAAPLITSRWAPGGRRELLSYRRIYEPADLAFRDAGALAQLAGALRQMGRPLVFERLFAASPTLAAMRGAIGRAAMLIVRPQAPTPWIALDESWSAPEQKLSSRRRSDFRRARRQAEQSGAIRAELLSPGEHEVDRLLDLAFEIERRSWKGETGTALADGRVGDFYRCYARRLARSGRFRIEFLHIGRKLAAMQLGVVHQHRYWVLKVGYDSQFHRASPGILLMVEAIKRAVAEGLETYELLGTVEPWIQVWTELERACVSLRYYPRSLGGGVALAADLMGKMRRGLPRRSR